jgi:hypothetical protein
MAGQPRFILLARFRLQPQALDGLQVQKLDFVWQTALNKFMDSIATIRKKDLNYKECPTYRSLNSALISAAPQLVHAFEKASSPSGRQMLAVGKTGMALPTPTQLNEVISVWAKQWAQANFKQTLEEPANYNLNLLKQLQADLELETQKATWQELEASTLWQESNNPLLYQAIPSLLANMLRGQASRIKGKDIVWRLAQNQARNKLVLVSEPQNAAFSQKSRFDKNVFHKVEGTFAYHLEFAVQTQAGSSQLWIHLYLSVRRYPDLPLEKINFQRNVTVMVGSATERLAGWGIDPTLVPIPIRKLSKDIASVKWANGLADLLGNVRFRSLAEPKDILSDPQGYRSGKPELEGDIYLPLFAEGMKPANKVKTGFGPQERSEVVASIAELLRDCLVVDEALKADEVVLKRGHTFSTALVSQKKRKQKTTQMPSSIAKRLSYALNGKPLQIVSFWYNSRTRDRVRLELTELFGLTEDPNWTEEIIHETNMWEKVVKSLQTQGIQIVEHSIDPSLVESFKVKKDSTSESAEDQTETKATDTINNRRSAWKEIWTHIPTLQATEYRLVLIEAPNHKIKSPKGVLRKTALLDGKAGSQLIQPVRSKKDEAGKPTNADKTEDIGRVKNGVADLLIRQTGTLLDSPFATYSKQAELPAELAKDLTIIGLYRIRTTNTNPPIDYAMAVRILPEGQIEACLPSHDPEIPQWLPYLAATNQIGRIFAGETKRNSKLKLDITALRSLLDSVLLQTKTGPTLIIAMADDWRSGIWPQFKNPDLSKNLLELKNYPNQPFTPADLPNLRIVRLRQKGSLGETPQYVATHPNKTWQNSEASKFFGVPTGFEDTSANSSLYHYLSVTQLPNAGRNQKGAKVRSAKRDKGGDIPFKYQSVLEIVPFFLQENDNPIEWARIVHLLRQTPAWSGGGLLLPYPIHLAHKAISDQLCMLE